jgi:hypothetical protein
MSNRGILLGRVALVIALVICSAMAVQAWFVPHRALLLPRDLDISLGLGFSTVVALSITFRSPLITDRIVFGAAAARFSLSLSGSLINLSAINYRSAGVILWTFAAVASAVALHNNAK